MLTQKERRLTQWNVAPRWLVEEFYDDSVHIAPPRVTGKCTGCRICELICSYHNGSTFNPTLSAIRIKKSEREWYEFESPSIFKANICRQCPGLAPCMGVCPALEEGALKRDERGAIIWDDDACIRCLKCVTACPYDAIHYNKYANKIIKCDLCFGVPKCVDWCPVGVLRYVKK